MLHSLTDYEYRGMNGPISFADGHAYHNLSFHYDPIINNLDKIWYETNQLKVVDLEQSFKNNFANLIGSDYLLNSSNFKICPTASNSIDIVATYLKASNKKILLVEPTFDNLHLIMKRRGCQVSSIQENELLKSIKYGYLDKYLTGFNFDTLFLVNPNNPTGVLLGESDLKEIVNYCSYHNKQIIIDTTFRMYSKLNTHDYRILSESEVSHIIIEDTGKTWPTHDMKASMIVYSDDSKNLLELIYEEIYLCHSRFVLNFFAHIFKKTNEIGIRDTIHTLINDRIAKLHIALDDTPLKYTTDRSKSTLPLEWIDCRDTGLNDIEKEKFIRSFGLHILPGRYFYWDRSNNNKECYFIRMSLARPQSHFDRGIEIISKMYK